MSVGSLAHDLQDRVLAALGRTPSDRTAVVRGMVAPGRGESAGYWLQLVIATMLATLGLALDSTAVVIGAMLIAPLMKPLVELSMGLATGSAALALRALLRTIASVSVVVLVATTIAWLLPFHDTTKELAARTAPNLLDLVVAGACALAAAYATLRADAEIATTAAGTSIGISLVPPLCACGYGLAMGEAEVARGAALLFTANLSGILIVAAAVFVLVGFAQVDIRHEEEAFDELRAPGGAVRVGRAWSRLAATRLGALARVVPPVLLLGVVLFPLQRAVVEIKHRSEIRRAVGALLSADKRRVVQYTLDHTASAVVLRVVVVGDPHAATELERELRARLRALDVKNPRLSVWAVPDAAVVSSLAHKLDDLPPPVAPEPIPKVAHRYSSEVAVALRGMWPRSGTGEVLGISLDLDQPDRLRVSHLGAPIGASGLQLLAHALEPIAGSLSVEEDALQAIEAPVAEGISWLIGAFDLVRRAGRVADIRFCVVLPKPPTGRRPDAGIATARAAFESLARGRADITVADGERWRIAPVRGPCPIEEASRTTLSP